METLKEEDLLCPVCLGLLDVPVTIPCGHSFCWRCIQRSWSPRGVRPSCPKCRKSFRTKPTLAKNIMLAGLVDQLKMMPQAELCYAGPLDVSCDICPGRKLKAAKSCLQCLVSYCENHLQPHNEVAVLEKHQLVAPFQRQNEHTCSEHNELKKMFCRNDQTFLCVICCMDHHKNHNTVSVTAERADKQLDLETRRQQLLLIVRNKESDLEKIHEEVLDINHSSQEAVQQSRDSFNRLIALLEERRNAVEKQIRNQQSKELDRVMDVQNQLEKDITELQKTISEIETLLSTKDHHQFLQQYSSPTLNIQSLRYPTVQTRSNLKHATTAAMAVGQELWQLLIPLLDFTARKELLELAVNIKLDPNTANPKLLLSDLDRETTFKTKSQNYNDHPERFDQYMQVLSKEGLTGRCYFEVGWSGKGSFRIGFAYKDIERKGPSNACVFGYNNTSWAFDHTGYNYSFWFNKVKTKLLGPKLSRIGVYLDHNAGALSFYSVCRTTYNMTLLHRVQTTFTQPLHVGVGFTLHDTETTVYFPTLKTENSGN